MVKNTRDLKHLPHQASHQMQFVFLTCEIQKTFANLSSIPVAHSSHCNRLSTHGFISSGPCRSKQRSNRSPRTDAMVRYLTSVTPKKKAQHDELLHHFPGHLCLHRSSTAVGGTLFKQTKVYMHVPLDHYQLQFHINARPPLLKLYTY